jgi:hypothetical protein
MCRKKAGNHQRKMYPRSVNSVTSGGGEAALGEMAFPPYFRCVRSARPTVFLSAVSSIKPHLLDKRFPQLGSALIPSPPPPSLLP